MANESDRSPWLAFTYSSFLRSICLGMSEPTSDILLRWIATSDIAMNSSVR